MACCNELQRAKEEEEDTGSISECELSSRERMDEGARETITVWDVHDGWIGTS
jgi:hypothetical protein